MATVELLCGAARSARARYLDGVMRANWGRAVLLVPTRRYALSRLEAVVRDGKLDGAWGRPVRAFDDFAFDLLRDEGAAPVRIADVERSALIETAIAAARTRPELASLRAALETGGFASHVTRVITELKQAAIEPADFRARVVDKPGAGTMDQAVASVYEEYQQALRDAKVYDLPGLFWEANTLCRAKRPAVLERVDVLLLDGFDDFTPSEFRLVEALERHVRLLAIGLNYDVAPGRSDLYSVPRKTAEMVRTRFSVTERVFEESEAESFSEFASSHLSPRDRLSVPPGLRRNIAVIPCADLVQETETIGRRIKTLLIEEKIPPDEIAIVYRNAGPALGTLRAVFDEFGIPLRAGAAPALTESAVCGFMLQVLDAAESWTRASVLEVLCAPWFRGGPPHEFAHADTFSLLTRAACIVAGYDEWQERLQRLAERIARGAADGLLEGLPCAAAAVATLLGAVGRLHDLLAKIPREASIADFAQALDGLIEDLRIPCAVDAYPEESIRASESAALAAFRRLLAMLAAWGASSDKEPRTVFSARLRRAIENSSYARPQPARGVVCMDAAAVRHLRFDYVFLAGVNEGEMPCPPPGNAIYSESDLERLRKSNVPLDGKEAHSGREILLFHHVFDVPRRHLFITWRLLSPRGQEKLPSPYVSGLLELFEGLGLQAAPPQANAFVPPPNEAGSLRDLKNAAFSDGGEALRDLFSRDFARVAEAANIEAVRHDDSPFGIYDGAISDPGLVASIRERFGPDHVFSVSQIETYRKCPFRFFVERLLGVEPAEEPAAEFDPRVRGSMMHQALQTFHERFRGIPVTIIPADEASAAMVAAVGAVFADSAWRSTNAPRGLVEAERRRMVALLLRYLEIARGRGETPWKPSHFEVSFGPVRDASIASPATAEPFVLDTPEGNVRFDGRIDRIDISEAGARLIDYKSSSSVAPKDLNEGRSIQLTVYALALEQLLMPGTLCAEAYFVRPGYDEDRECLGRGGKTPMWDLRRAVALDTIAQSVRGIREGRFPPLSDEDGGACSYCPARRACRFDQGRVARKQEAGHA